MAPSSLSYTSGRSSASSLSRTETYSLLTLSICCFAIVANTFNGEGEPLLASIAFSGIAFALTYACIRWLGETFIQAGLKGRDMAKTRKTEIPETMGAVCAMVYLLIIIIFIPFPFYKDIVAATSGGGNRDVVIELKQIETGRFLHRFPHSKLASYLSAILSLQSVVLLGIGDDLFDIRWRHKVLIPAFASIPMLIVYFVDFGVTQVVVPVPLQPYLGDLIDLGYLYYIYMASISIFCPNSINILAGINGIEVSQSILIATLLVINDLLYLIPFPSSSSSSAVLPPNPATDPHLFSLYILLPFLGTSLALLTQNWYPARVFVGDTYCYFAGMVFAVVGIQGHFSKTLLLLFIPQIFNFIYSAPQLFHLIPCPRHRLPHFNARSGLLEPSMAVFDHRLAPPVERTLKFLARLHLVRLQYDDKNAGDAVVACSNLTLLNLWLVWFGPMREDRLALGILTLAAGCGIAGLLVRHQLALWVFREDNLRF